MSRALLHPAAANRSAAIAGRFSLPALLLGLVAVIAVTAFTLGRSFAGSSNCGQQQLLHAGGPVNVSADPRFAGRFSASTAQQAGSGDGSSTLAAAAGDPQQQQPRYVNMTEHPACTFFRSGANDVTNEHGWGPYDQCDMNRPHDWLKRARSNCYSCISGANVCTQPPTMLYHQYLEFLHPTLWEGNLLSIKVFLMTQDLEHAHMIVWVPDPSKVVVPNKTAAFFKEFSDYVSVRAFEYDAVIKGTPFQDDPFFGNATLVKQHFPHAGSYSDIVRILTLNKYGGFWMDNDVVLYQDVTHLLSTSYQFVMRWMNLHIMRMEKGSRLMQRTLKLATSLPLNHPDFENTIVNKLCKPNGYYQLVASDYGFTDIYNGCLFRLLLRFNNTGPPDAVLYDMPLGWWDHDWKGCFKSRKNISDTKWREVATHYLAMHNRYPKDPNLGEDTPDVQDTPLSRVLRTVGAFWSACGRKECTPVDGMSIMAYDAFDPHHHGNQRRRRRRLLLRQLLERHQQQRKLLTVRQQWQRQQRQLLWQ